MTGGATVEVPSSPRLLPLQYLREALEDLRPDLSESDHEELLRRVVRQVQAFQAPQLPPEIYLP